METVTVWLPDALAGAVQVSEVDEPTDTPVAAVPPTDTVVPPEMKLVPVRVRDVPPATGRLVFGDTPLRVGAPIQVKALDRVLE